MEKESIIIDELLSSELSSISKQIQNINKKPIAIYTVVFNLPPPIKLLKPSYSFDVIVIGNNLDENDENLKGRIVVNTDFTWDYSRKTSRFFKFLPHVFLGNYECSLYFDSNCVLKEAVIGLIESFRKSEKDFLFFRHNKRSCIYEEIQECVKYAKDDPGRLKIWEDFIRSKNYPKNNGLIQGGFILRKHNNLSVIKLMKSWAFYYDKFTGRDQLVLNFVAWESGVSLDYIEGNQTLHDGSYSYIIPHKTTRIGERLSFGEFFKIHAYNFYLHVRTFLNR